MRILTAFALFAAAFALQGAESTTKLHIVIKTPGGHPIDGAAVVVRWHANPKHPAARYGKAVTTTWEIRSNQEGEVNVPEIPQGSIQIQVIAKGFQTYGKVFEVDEEEKTLEIGLNPPQQQYSSHQ